MKRVTAPGQSVGQKHRVVERLRGLPPGTMIPAESLVEWLSTGSDELPTEVQASLPPPPATSENWRTLLWTAPSECRIGRDEVCEALGRPRSWLYRQTSTKAEHRIPHRKLDGELVFIVGEIRTWLREVEEVVHVAQLDANTEPLRKVK
jgi:predicted DNA-binding transcriptional regulator AlpA